MTDAQRKAHREARRRFRAAHPEKAAQARARANERWRAKAKADGRWQAQRAVYKAVRRGTLIRPAICDACSKPPERGGIQAHHEDYDKRFEVDWLCPLCHAEATMAGRGVR